MTPTLVNAVGARERAAASFLRRSTGCTGGIGPQAVPWKDLWTPHDGQERRLDKNPGSSNSQVPANWGSQLSGEIKAVLGPTPSEENVVEHVGSRKFQSEARLLSLEGCVHCDYHLWYSFSFMDTVILSLP